MTNRVPQGSVLGPILYILYVNELTNVINDPNCNDSTHKDKTKLFTDNCSKFGSIPTYAADLMYQVSTNTRFEAQEKINVNIEKIKTFLDANSLSINMDKTEILETMIRQKRTRILGVPPQLSITNREGILKVIEAKVSYRLLGTNLNSDMTWKHHLETGDKPILPGIRSQIGILRHIGQNMLKKSRLLLANGLIINRILYLIPMWGGLSGTEMRKIQVLLNRCARLVTGLSRRTRMRTLMQVCNWLYAMELVKYHLLLQMWRMLQLGSPYNLSRLVSLDTENKVSMNNSRIVLVRNSFKWRAVKDWNELEDDLRAETSL